MPSRKRAKGKERKATLAIKRAALTRASWFQYIVYGEQNKSIQCRHGLDELSVSIPPQGHCVSNMLDVFGKDTDDSNEQSMYEFMEELFNEHPEVWGDDNNRTMAMSILLNLGTNHILRGEYITASSYARAVAVIEKHEMGGSFESAFFHGARTVIKINGGNRRDLLRFYYKRISCSCLKIKYKNAAKIKRGSCFGCLQTFDRAVLYVCGRCRTDQYCSMKCQGRMWFQHKKNCDTIVKACGIRSDRRCTLLVKKSELTYYFYYRSFMSRSFS